MFIDECRTPCRDCAPAPGTYDQSPIDPAKPAAYFKLQHQETSGAWRVFLPEKAELDDRYPTGEAIRLREELSEQIRSLEEGKRLFVNLVPVLSP